MGWVACCYTYLALIPSRRIGNTPNHFVQIPELQNISIRTDGLPLNFYGKKILFSTLAKIIVFSCFFFLRQSMASVPESGTSQDAPPQVTCIIAFSKGFICSGGAGTVHLFEKTEEKDFYKKAREIKIPVDTQSPDPQLSESQEIVNLTVSPSEETLVCSTKSSQLYCITMSTADLGKVRNPL